MTDVNYAWIVTKDKITTPEEHARYVATNGKEGLRSRKGWLGPRNAPKDLCEALKKNGVGIKWRCRDDDDNIYYYGRLIEAGTTGLNDMSAEALSAPLDNFATPDAGACKIEHYNTETRKWEYIIG